MKSSPFKAGKTKFSPPRPISQYPKDSIQKLAVLFTDIVGSSNYFKSYGDIAGRRMLKKHQDMTSAPINEHGGVLVKLLGDSVMSYFLDAKEALKAAIKIQQAFQRNNQQHDLKGQIHIRVCIHFGDGIVEENDIFGDVVNMAAKFLNLVEGDQIYVSQEVYGQVAASMHSVQFLPVKVAVKKKELKSLNLYRVVWDKTVDLDPVLKTLIYLKPVWSLAKKSFTEVWNALLNHKAQLWTANSIIKENILQDKSIVLIVKKAESSVTIIKRVMDFLKLNMGHDSTLFIPLQGIVDCGPFLKADRLSLDTLKINWKEIKPGEIYISGPAHNKIKNYQGMSVVPIANTNQPQTFYKLLLDSGSTSDSNAFLYQNALVQGDLPPCFYCGDRRHLTTNCPSKQLSEMNHVWDKLGYLHMDEMNNLFLDYLNKSASNPEMILRDGHRRKSIRTDDLAYYGFYDLKAVYQLRFFQTIWNLKEENWNKVKEIKSQEDKGGLLWIGMDCLRVNNMDQAESILKDFLVKEPKDYKVYCAMGFLCIEKNDLLQAKFLFKKALDFTKSTPQKIFVLFQLSRVYDLLDDPIRSQATIRKITYMSPYCPEALYQDILFKFRKGDKAIAVHQLTKLIKKNRDYYIIALIDPELSNFGKLIHDKLEILFKEAKEEAQKGIPDAKDAFERLKKLLGENEKDVQEAQSLLNKIEELLSTDSYFAYIDIIHYNYSIVNMSQRLIEGRKTKLSTNLWDLKQRITKYFDHVKRLTYPSLGESINFQLKGMQRRLDKNFEIAETAGPDQFKKAFIDMTDMAKALDRIDQKLKRLDNIEQILIFLIRFLKRSVIYQSINLVIALILFPIAIHYINFIIPDLNVTPQNIWYFQKLGIILGGIAGIFLASITTPKN